MRKLQRIHVYVGAIIIATALVMVLAWHVRMESPDPWAFASFLLVTFLLHHTKTLLRVGAAGSLSFVMHLAGAIVFGGFWGAVIAGVSTAVSMLLDGRPGIQLAFNSAQRALSVAGSVLLYTQVFHGNIPPAYLNTAGATGETIQHDLLLFFVFSGSYVLINSCSVSGAVALSTNRPFREVWHLNTRGLVGYDLGASVIAVLVAWCFTRIQAAGYGPIGLLAVAGPIIVVRRVYDLYYQLQDTGQELLQVMVKAIEARDPYTSGHSLRVRELSRTIALELGLPAREVEQIETAALLHDVGKIHEEFAPLLRKEGRLTPEETALMQTHAAKSAELVGIISKFRGTIQDCVRHHHERWDGQGYPQGLAETGIPMGARIILVSDTIDAMTTDRPYRKRLALDVVVAELQKCKGTQFDPNIVEVVISSVAVRSLIVDPAIAPSVMTPVPRSKRVSWPAASLAKAPRRAFQ